MMLALSVPLIWPESFLAQDKLLVCKLSDRKEDLDVVFLVETYFLRTAAEGPL